MPPGPDGPCCPGVRGRASSPECYGVCGLGWGQLSTAHGNQHGPRQQPRPGMSTWAMDRLRPLLCMAVGPDVVSGGRAGQATHIGLFPSPAVAPPVCLSSHPHSAQTMLCLSLPSLYLILAHPHLTVASTPSPLSRCFFVFCFLKRQSFQWFCEGCNCCCCC